jgi:P-type Ca2+ transporter type 2C
MKDAYSKKEEQVVKFLETDAKKGLSEKDAKARLVKYGRNSLVHLKKVSSFTIFIRQFKNPLVYILLAAIVVSFLIKRFVDGWVIFAIVVLNSLFGFYQEHKAEKSLELLKKMGAPHAKVIRNGVAKTINSDEVVPGDILVLETGDKAAADARILSSSKMEINESVLTGESSPVEKKIGALKEGAVLADRINMVYGGTIVTYGHGLAVVTGTGGKTEFGKIASSLSEIKAEETPLQKSLATFSKKVGIGVLGIVILLFVIGLFRGLDLVQNFMTAVSLAVAAIPEGLPAVVTITLALGTQRMVKSRALVRKLSAIETLGSTTVVCSDKTGTLTAGVMDVTHVYVDGKMVGVTGEGYSLEGKFTISGQNFDPKRIDKLLECAWLCNDSKLKGLFGDPTELALKVAAKKGGVSFEGYERVDEVPFDSSKKYMITLDRKGNKKVLHLKGAPEVVLGKCNFILVNGRKVHLTTKMKEKILDTNHKMAKNALRVLGFAFAENGNKKDMTFLGLMGMRDPPRKEARNAINVCKKAGIKVVMITGDNSATAQAVARELGLGTEVMVGEELEKLSDDRLKHLVKQIDIFARVNPEHKVRVLKALQANNEIVSMTGDGINDAPALKKANVGVAMGKTGTDVSREAADIVLLDDGFHSIVLAIKEGRAIFDNIKKFVRFLFSANLAEIGVIATAIFAGFPLPLLPLQILWINLITDGIPALALGVDPAEKGVMSRKPRKMKDGVLHGSYGFLFLSGLIGTVITLAMFFPSYLSGDLDKARTLAFMTLIMFELFLVFSARSNVKSAIDVGLFSNKFLVFAVLGSISLQFILLYTPLAGMFSLVSLGLIDWGKIILIALAGVLALEIEKKLVNRKKS